MLGAINGIGAALSLVSTVFFVIGAVAYSNNFGDLTHVCWLYADDFGTKLYVGLQSIGVAGNGQENSIKFASDVECAFDFCSDCEESGRGTFGAVIGAAVLATAVVVLSLVSMVSHSNSLQVSISIVALCSAMLAAVALGLLMGQCQSKMEHDLNNFNFVWGSGAILTIIGMMLMTLTSMLLFTGMCSAPRRRRSSSPTAVVPVMRSHPPTERIH